MSPGPTPTPHASLLPLPSGRVGLSAKYPSPDTPGLPNPAVNQANIQQTVCVKGWTATIRPPAQYTTALKVRQIAQRTLLDTNAADYEEDHYISLELGGHPTDERNLWPEPYRPLPGAREKDQVENHLREQVCSGAMTLAAAQQAITADWLAIFQGMSHQ
ncbi:MAG TPA: hypothetical protein VIU62_05160 [Chloroflexota bacterium]